VFEKLSFSPLLRDDGKGIDYIGDSCESSISIEERAFLRKSVKFEELTKCKLL
jgi:hypothetical protein